MADVSVSTHIDAPPRAVWAAVADPQQLSRWSPENTGARVRSEGPAPLGSTFAGHNRKGPWRWTTQCRVVESTADEAFAFDVSFLGVPVARWRYVLTPHGRGTTVEEQWWDRRGPLMAALGTLGTGVADRRTHNETSMRATLASLKTALEGRQG